MNSTNLMILAALDAKNYFAGVKKSAEEKVIVEITKTIANSKSTTFGNAVSKLIENGYLTESMKVTQKGQKALVTNFHNFSDNHLGNQVVKMITLAKDRKVNFVKHFRSEILDFLLEEVLKEKFNRLIENGEAFSVDSLAVMTEVTDTVAEDVQFVTSAIEYVEEGELNVVEEEANEPKKAVKKTAKTKTKKG